MFYGVLCVFMGFGGFLVRNIANFDGKIQIFSEKWIENGEKW
jgi:hypothetical protein